MAVDDHKANLPFLSTDDVVCASYPGSGSSWLGNIYLELGLCYIDLYTERLANPHSQETRPIELDYRRRHAAIQKKDLCQAARSFKEPIRLMKTHFYPHQYNYSTGRVVLLIRDGRDAVHSQFHWRQGFLLSGTHDSFSQFLGSPGFNGKIPLVDWAEFNQSWEHMCSPSNLHHIQFERVREDPEGELLRLLAFLGVCRAPSDVQRAIELSSFQAMQRHEEQHIPTKEIKGRIMRSGRIGQWKTAFADQHEAWYDEAIVKTTLHRYGYDVDQIDPV